MVEQVPQKRLFIGIPLPIHCIEILMKIREKNESIKKIRWTPPQNLHITLYFIGSKSETDIPGIVHSIQNLAQDNHPFYLNFDQFKLAPRKRPYMIWAVYQPLAAFVHLSKAMVNCFDPSPHIAKEPMAHITLARFKYLKNPDQIELPMPAGNLDIHVDRVVLWESILKPTGAEYAVVQSFPLC